MLTISAKEILTYRSSVKKKGKVRGLSERKRQLKGEKGGIWGGRGRKETGRNSQGKAKGGSWQKGRGERGARANHWGEKEAVSHKN